MGFLHQYLPEGTCSGVSEAGSVVDGGQHSEAVDNGAPRPLNARPGKHIQLSGTNKPAMSTLSGSTSISRPRVKRAVFHFQ